MSKHPYPTGKYETTCNCAACAVAERDELRAKVAAAYEAGQRDMLERAIAMGEEIVNFWPSDEPLSPRNQREKKAAEDLVKKLKELLK